MGTLLAQVYLVFVVQRPEYLALIVVDADGFFFINLLVHESNILMFHPLTSP